MFSSRIIGSVVVIRGESRCYNKESKDSVSSPAVTPPGFFIVCRQDDSVLLADIEVESNVIIRSLLAHWTMKKSQSMGWLEAVA
jgi:hypothetical protein